MKWGEAAERMRGSHVEEVRDMVREYRREVVVVGGESLTVAQVAAVAEGKVMVVELDEGKRRRVEESSAWVIESLNKGMDSYGVTTGFGATSHRRTARGVALQAELIRSSFSLS